MSARIERAVRALGRRTISAYPWTARPLGHARSVYAGAYLAWVRGRSYLSYDAPIDPFRVDRIPPSAIERTAEFFDDAPKYRRAGRVVGGNWDRHPERFTDRTLYRSFRAHFEDGVPWEETRFFAEILDRMEDGERWWGCRCRADFERRCAELDELYENIARNGVRSQAELLGSDGPEPARKDRPNGLARRIEDDIAVHVGRDGEFLFCDGRNRLAIAKLLDVQSVPVRIMVRHEGWQSFRDDVAAGRVEPGQHADHPDIRPLLG
ncbi:hypothetical protein [Haloarchaeobius litoreus]|uniref:ParB-like nuclease domain-containing protein n=1 Tax=Haloarchaeobius litoreus TaxID=755306 RepID=A0ABD6DN55_9EURY|nr:hypothetical protein [Haloarchaeobius litoreus]